MRQLSYRKTEELIPYAANSRTHTEAQIDQIAASIKKFSFTNPVLIGEDGTIIAGHGRVMAAKKLGMDEVPCLEFGDWTEDMKRAYVIADNQLALNAGWDEEVLAGELQLLGEHGFDTSVLGLSDKEIDRLIRSRMTHEGDPDEEVPLPENAVSKPGDIWVLGDHRIMCGDSTNAENVEALLSGHKPHLMVTDPPYGVEYDANWRNEVDRANGKPYGASAIGIVQNDEKADWRDAWALFPGEVAYVWHADRHAKHTIDALESCGFELRAQIIWGKNQLVIGRGHYHVKHEPCYYAVRKGGTGHWNGDRKQTTVWEIDKPQKSETGHSTQKPVECMRRPIENNSAPGDYVYEPFSGSGTTIIAAEMTGRRCLAMELHPPYVDIAVTRWQNFTGKQAIHAQTGKPFNGDV